MKEILIITNYYPPETGAASNRICHLAEGLLKHDFNVSVITPLPNYPNGEISESYKGHFKVKSNENGIKIQRLWIYASNSKNKILRLLAMLSYSFSLTWFFLWNKIPKTVIVQSPPLLVAFTSMLFLKSNKRRLILNVSDLWPIAGFELGVFKKNFSYKILEKIERFNYQKADLVLGQSDEILNHIASLFPNKNTFLYRNYPNFTPPELSQITHQCKKLKLVYAGLIGVAQGIFKLCTELNYKYVQLHIYGSGSEKSKIETLINNNPNLDVVYHGEISRSELHQELLKYDLAIIPLLNRIYGSVPSKIFEYAKLGLPMIYFGGGEGEKIIEKHRLGYIAKPSDYANLNKVISNIKQVDLHLNHKKQIQTTASVYFNFDDQLKLLVENINMPYPRP